MRNLELTSTMNAASYKPSARLKRIFETIGGSLPNDAAFEVELGGERLRIGAGQVKFRVVIHNRQGVSALCSLDEKRIGEAYLDGDITVEGDLVAALDLRAGLNDRHLFVYLWSTYGQRLFYGQVNRDKQWIHEHYDNESDFYLLFLDERHRCYSHGYFADDNEPLSDAIGRKLDTAIEACGIQPGWRVLDIGAGWGAFTEHAGKRGVQVTSLTISAESERYVNDLISRKELPCRVIREHFLEYASNERYDAIVNLGVTEHLPDYAATLAQYEKLLKPGGRVFLDACASSTKYPFSSFVLSHVWPGNATPLKLAEYIDEVAKTPFELIYARNDRHNYLLTTKRWAETLDERRDEIIARWGERLYRRFRLYLWGCVHSFSTDDVTAYRLLLELPAKTQIRNKPASGRFARTPNHLFGRLKDSIRKSGRSSRAQRS